MTSNLASPELTGPVHQAHQMCLDPFGRPAPCQLDEASEIADAIFGLLHTYGNIKARLANTADPEIAALFLLVRLVKGGPKRAKELADSMNADPSTVSRQVASLVKSGLVERKADPDDGRASILVPTQSGERKVADHFVNRGQVVEPMIADWSAADRADFLRLLRSYGASLEARREEVLQSWTTASALARSGHQPPPPPNPTPPHPHHSSERSY